MRELRAAITLDLHGKNAYQARVTVDAALRRSVGVYQIRLIHGYHGGDALKEMLYAHYMEDPRVLEVKPGDNPGQTVLVLRRL